MDTTNQTLSSIMNARQQRLTLAMQLAGIDALALNPGSCLYYLTGLDFHLMERPVVAIFRPHSPIIFILPELEYVKLANFPLPVQGFPYGEDPETWQSVFSQALLAANLHNRRVGLEPTRLRVLELRLLEKAGIPFEWANGESVLSDLRMTKDAREISAMRTAVEIAEKALLATLPLIKAGMREDELGSELVIQLLRHGSESILPFRPIIASGPNSALPHAVGGERRLTYGDLLIIDWGASYQGYFSDLTRTFEIGETEPELRQIARIVMEGNLAAQAAASPGVRAGSVDEAAREVIRAAGYGEYFIHRTGHGLGLEAHEHPYIYAQNNLHLAPGMTFTIEPGIYLPGRGGVRIEDNFVITANGGESLSTLPRELIGLG